jgi:uncharacterized protein
MLMSGKPGRNGTVAAILLSLIAANACSSRPAPTMPSTSGNDGIPQGVRIDKDGVFANFYPAEGRHRGPAVLVLGGSEGGLVPQFNEPIRQLRAAGFAVLYLCYFGCPGKPQQLSEIPLETFDRGLAFLRTHPGIDPNRIAIFGLSKGAEAALLVATRDPKLKAVIAAAPSSVAWPGITLFPFSSSWTVGGRPVPFLHYTLRSYWRGFKGVFSRTPIDALFGFYSGALPTLAHHPEAVIPVERITAPILLICGEADRLWPSYPMAIQIADRLKAKGRPAPRILHYKNAGHAAFGPPVEKTDPVYLLLAQAGGTPEGNEAAHADSWPKAMAFLKASLGVP